MNTVGTQTGLAHAAATVGPEVWLGERPPGHVLETWGEMRGRLGLDYPNNEPARFFATCGAIEGARSVVVRVDLQGGGCGLLIGRASRRRERIRLGFLSLNGPASNTVDVVRGGLLSPAGREHDVVRDAGRSLWALGFRRAVWNAVPTESGLDGAVRACGRCVPAPAEERYWLKMEPGSDHPLAHRSSKSRSKIRRYDRLLVEHFGGDVTLDRITRPDQVAGFCAACDAISKASYHEKIGYGVRDNTLWRSMLTAAAETGYLRAYLLRCGGEAVAYQNGSVFGDTYTSDGKGFDRRYDEHRPGTILLHRMLVELHAEGVRAIDFGVGESEYKDVFSNAQTPECRLTTYGPGVGGVLGAGGARLLRWIERAGGRLSATRLGRGLRARLVRMGSGGER